MSDTSQPDDLSALRRIEDACARFEAAWQDRLAHPDRPPPRLEDALPAVPESERPRLLQELLRLDVAYRRQAGEHPAPEDYQPRFPAHAALIREAFPPDPNAGTADTVILPPGARVRYFGDYEVLDELGRGAFGIVYRARQRSLHRTVALKMIRPGAETPELVQRFRFEAEMVAQLEHPGIVPLYEFGEHEGQHYFSMRLIEGSNLKDAMGRVRGDLRKAVAMLEKVARAVHHAHQRGVLHRDLKPSNVLLDRADSPYVTDFGLARRLAGVGASASGTIVGTASYMSPEQARGDRVITTATDVYGLGAILYEMLTGQPPFTGDDTLAVLLKVRNEEPIRPSVRVPGVDRDLETVCLACLEKDSAKRYGTAEEMAEELARWTRGEPILRRPVSSAERAWRWCKRNRALATALAAGAASLVIGITLTTMFMLIAQDRAAKEAAARRDLAEANVSLVRSAARSVITPLAILPVGGGDPREPLALVELEAIWRLAGEEQEAVRMGVVEEAVRDPSLGGQLRSRRRYAVHAAVGLVVGRQAGAERRLAEGLASMSLPEGQRADLALLLSELGELRPETAQQVTNTLIEAMARTRDAGALAQLAEGVAAVAGRLQPKAATGACRQAAAPIIQAMTITADTDALERLAEGLAAVAGRMEPKEAAAIIIKAMNNGPGGLPLVRQMGLAKLAQTLATVAGRLQPREAADTLTRSMTGTIDRGALMGFSEGLGTVVGWLELWEAREAAATLSHAMSRTTDEDALAELAGALAAVAGRLEPKEASETCLRAATTLTQVMGKTTNPYGLLQLADGLEVLVGRLGPEEAKEACRRVAAALTQAITKADETHALARLAEALAAVAGRLEPREAFEICRPAAAALTRAVAQAADEGRLAGLGVYERHGLADGLAAVAGRLEPKEGAAILIRAMIMTPNEFALESLAEALAAVAGRLESKEASEACRQAVAPLARVMTKSTYSDPLGVGSPVYERDPLAKSLAAVAVGLEPEEAKEAIAYLIQARAKVTKEYKLGLLTWGLAVVAVRLDPHEAVSCLTQAMAKTSDVGALKRQAEGLAAVASRLEPKEAARVCRLAAAAIIQGMANSTEWDDPEQLAKGLAAVADRLEPKEAAATLNQAMAKTTNGNALARLAAGMAAAARRMQPKEASQACRQATATLTLAMTKAEHGNGLAALAEGLVAVVDWLEPEEASKANRQAASTLTQAITKSTSEHTLVRLTSSLAGLAVRLEPGEAKELLTPLVHSLNAQNSNHAGLLEALLVLAARLPPRESSLFQAKALRALPDSFILGICSSRPRPGTRRCGLQGLCRETRLEEPDVWSVSVYHDPVSILAGLLGLEDPLFRLQRNRGLAAAVGLGTTPAALLAVPALAQPAAQAMPEPPPDEALVVLLKHPFCVGKVRRLVLDALEVRHGRPFADQWEFVRYATERKLPLDFTSPPQRPAPLPPGHEAADNRHN